MHWYFYAVFTVICWGFHYNSLNYTAKHVSPIFLFWLPVVPLVALLPFYYRTMITDMTTVYTGSLQLKGLILLSMILSLVGTVSLFKAIQLSGNPTMVGLIEITYPVAIAIVAYLFFNEQHVNIPMLFGGALILLGSGIVVYYNG